MSFEIILDPKVEDILRKMWQKDSARFCQLEKKLLEQSRKTGDRKTPEKPLKGFWRLHIGHYVLMYKIDKKNQKITLVDCAHHDEIY